MKTKPQVIFDNGKPAFVVLRYEDYVQLTGTEKSAQAVHQTARDLKAGFARII